MAPRVTRDFGIGPFERSAGKWLDDVESRPAPSEPARAATVMVVRGEPLEVFMIERAATMDFAPSTWVFPGGRVDPADAGVAELSLCTASGGLARWARKLGLPEAEAAAVLGCVLRELFEEAGVLMASTALGGALCDTSGQEWAERRAALEAHQVTFESVAQGLHLRADLLDVVDRWVTPEFEHRRFDTWFFVAEVPAGSLAHAVSRESVGGRWVRPAEILGEFARGEISLLPPTLTALERLLGCQSAADAAQKARQAEFETTHPRVLRGPKGLYLQAEVNL